MDGAGGCNEMEGGTFCFGRVLDLPVNTVCKRKGLAQESLGAVDLHREMNGDRKKGGARETRQEGV